VDWKVVNQVIGGLGVDIEPKEGKIGRGRCSTW